jgi:hypothetical protein
MGYKFNAEAVLNSELRVLKTLDFDINITTPYHFVELLFEVLGRQMHELEVKVFYYIAVSVLYKFYPFQEEIYGELHLAVSGQTKDLSGQ